MNEFQSMRKKWKTFPLNRMRIQILFITLIASSICRNSILCCKQLYQRAEENVFYVDELLIVPRKSSLIECLLVCTREGYDCDMVGYYSIEKECVLYRESAQMKEFDQNEIELYVKSQSSQTVSIPALILYEIWV